MVSLQAVFPLKFSATYLTSEKILVSSDLNKPEFL